MLEISLAVEYASQVVTLMATPNIHNSSSGVIADLFHRADVPPGTSGQWNKSAMTPAPVSLMKTTRREPKMQRGTFCS